MSLVIEQHAFLQDVAKLLQKAEELGFIISGGELFRTPIVYPKGQAEITGVLVEIAPGSETGWHLHPAPSFAFVLEGELAVQLKDSQVKKT